MTRFAAFAYIIAFINAGFAVMDLVCHKPGQAMVSASVALWCFWGASTLERR